MGNPGDEDVVLRSAARRACIYAWTAGAIFGAAVVAFVWIFT